MSVYHFIKKNKTTISSILICGLIAGILCCFAYPGFMYTDTYSRIFFAEEYPAFYNEYFGDKLVLYPISVSYLPALMMIMTHSVSNEWGLYIFLQSFLFILMLYFWGKKASANKIVLSVVLVILAPIYLFYSIFWECGVGCLTVLMFLVLLWSKYNDYSFKYKKETYVAISLLCVYLIIGYRPNAITVIPALIVAAIFFFKEVRVRVRIIFAILAGTLFITSTDNILQIDTMNTHCMGMMWEIVSTIQESGEEKEYQFYLDYFGGNGATVVALENNTYKSPNSSVNDIWWGSPFEMKSVDGGVTGIFLREKYTRIIKEQPASYLKVKATLAANTLGFNGLLADREYYYDRNERMSEYGFNDCKMRHFIYDSFITYNKYFCVHRIPWIFFIIALAIFIIKVIKLKKSAITWNEMALLVAFFYYGGFLVNTQAFEFRYFFPSWVLLTWYIAGNISMAINYAKKTRKDNID